MKTTKSGKEILTKEERVHQEYLEALKAQLNADKQEEQYYNSSRKAKLRRAIGWVLLLALVGFCQCVIFFAGMVTGISQVEKQPTFCPECPSLQCQPCILPVAGGSI